MNCKGCTGENLDVEIFGLARNGSTADRPGLLHLAQDGTLYISEVDALVLPVQQRLLQYLQNGSFTRRGRTRTERAETRIIASSNADLSALCQQGRFLSELAERLAAHVIELPTLTQRLDDMELQVQSLLNLHGAHRGIHGIDEDSLALLRAHTWPGNLRELEDCIRHAVEHAVEGVISVASLPRTVRDVAERNLPRSAASSALRPATAEAASGNLVPMRRPEGRIDGTHTSQTGLATAGAGSPGRNREARPWDINDEDPVSLDLYEKKALLRALSEADGDKLVAAKRLKLGKSTMYRKLKRYGIP
jgi:DNA-binding NtrC family response regulator